MAEVLQLLGSEHALVVHSADGLDEISIAAETLVVELKDGAISQYSISPEDFSMDRQDLSGLSVNGAKESAALIRGALSGFTDAPAKKAAAIVALNAGATIYVSGIATSLAAGVAMAEDLISTGQAWEKLREFVDFTQLVSANSGK
jgi:anthranilate phosphoribosyltransferase